MSKRRKKSVQKPIPIVIVPDKSYTDDAGGLIPTDITLITHTRIYLKMVEFLADWKKQG